MFFFQTVKTFSYGQIFHKICFYSQVPPHPHLLAMWLGAAMAGHHYKEYGSDGVVGKIEKWSSSWSMERRRAGDVVVVMSERKG